MKYLIGMIAGAGLAAAAPLQTRATDSYFFTLWVINCVSIYRSLGRELRIRSGNSYTMTSFDVGGTQPTAGNPMGNPALGGFFFPSSGN